LELGDGQARQFAFPEPAEHHRLVDQRSLHAERFETVPGLGLECRDGLPLSLAPSHCLGVEQGATAGHFEKAHQLGFGHRPALAARVGLLIGPG